MDLRQRLRALGAAGSTPPDPAAAAGPPAGALAAAPAARAPGPWAGRLLPTPAGPAFAVETAYPLDHRRGRLRLAEMLGVPGAGWARLGRHPAWTSFDPARAVFLDTETTGLERGAGTYIFLAGLGRFDGSALRVRQFFLRDYDEEPALLHALLAELAGASAVITFNGRGFDWPLLVTRATLNRLRVPDLPHLDLLYPARRFWKDHAESCRLVHLESAVLGETRSGDVPGHLIPQRFFAYLQTGDAGPLAEVLEHNRLDILSLAALAGYLGTTAAAPLHAAPGGAPVPGHELFALGRLLLEDGELAAGIACLHGALERDLRPDLRPACQRALATAYRRAAAHHQAVAIWWELAREQAHSPIAYVELAKHYEHREKDLARARDLTLRALEIVLRHRTLLGLRGSISPALERDLQDLQRRLRRLEARLRRAADPHP